MLGLITGYTVGSLSTIIYPFPTLIILPTKIGSVVTPPRLTSATYAKSPICKEEFIMYGPYDRFCGSCKSTDFYRLDHSYSLGIL